MQTTELTQENIRPNVPHGYMRNAQGHLVPDELVPDIDKARDELVHEIIGNAERMRDQMAAFKETVMGDLRAFVDLSAEKYGVKMGGSKGNTTFASYDGRYKIRIDVSEYITFDERLQIAKELIDRCIHKWAQGSGAEIRALVEHAFQTDKEGKISVGRVLGLTRLKIDDEQWQSAMKAVHDSMQVSGTTTYMRIYRRVGDSDQYEQLSLDFSKL
ncbi:Protein of unknown function [Nitrosomonas aestuarii]|uniref:Sulfate transporter n=1 Tax=Nitrosomonas aestuarii TaxID=52441 RepID=A0A1I4DJ87_9PROT|nr:DUF3164 family protein [Nitrosomonas aestuarii]SFK92979.1 Protein of unknown function [Nitrosomonas aestuarii]